MNYDEFASEIFAPFFAPYAAKILERTGEHEGRLLDLGSGGGHLGFALMDVGDFESVTFLDKNQQALENTRARAERSGYTADECAYYEHDAVTLDCFDSDSFDLIVSRGSMHFWSDPIAALREVYRVLKPGAHAYLGGGIGVNIRQTRRIEKLMVQAAEQGRFNPGHMNRSGDDERNLMESRSAFARDFIDLCTELNCSYAAINSKGEGGWYLFCKDGVH